MIYFWLYNFQLIHNMKLRTVSPRTALRNNTMLDRYGIAFQLRCFQIFNDHVIVELIRQIHLEKE